MTARPRLTPHQREVYARIVRLAAHRAGSVAAGDIGSAGAVAHLVEKGYVTKTHVATGPRGREFFRLSPRLDNPG